ncbi:MAG: aminoacetone oxidase family FAD-binding enzyme [Oscillospiraceae bacterium]|nr:aminoacetone oxidase family FAD-binding enzyme [Oscillospiraceae bacterium]
MVIGIIGAGASGMAAALAAAENEHVQVLLMERQSRVGRKLAATGNGRCNLTNLHADRQGYHGETPEFIKPAMERYNVDDTLNWFAGLGLYTVAEDSGRVYPYSDQANSVVDVLRFALDRPNIQLLTGFEVKKVKKVDGGFRVESAEEAVFCEKLIIACGGLAGTKLGGSMAGYQLLRELGHKCTRLRPTLVQLKSSWSGCPSLKGVRANCHVQIIRDGEVHAQSRGEIQFTEYGFSGPVIFEVSRDTCYGRGNWACRLDFLPGMDRETLRRELLRRRDTNRNAEELLTGILHNRLGRVLTQSVGIKGTWKIADLREDEIDAVCGAVKNFEAVLTDTMGMEAAQVTAGGILTAEFDPQSMESHLVPGLYACGEVLDIDGDCGGYNLQWAWSSGRLAGSHAGGNT